MDSPETSPEPDRRTCQALLEDELTPCTRTLNPRTNSRWCPPHGKEYKEHTRTYKTLSDQVRALKDAARLSRKRRQELATTDEVDAAIARVEEWREAILSEIAARIKQHKRFFPVPDAGHEQWIQGLRADEEYAADLIEQLRARKAHLLAEDEAQRRRIEDTKRAWLNWREREDARIAAEARERRRLEDERRERTKLLPATSAAASWPSPAVVRDSSRLARPTYGAVAATTPAAGWGAQAPRRSAWGASSPEYWQYQATAHAPPPQPVQVRTTYVRVVDVERQVPMGTYREERPEEESSSSPWVLIGLVLVLAWCWWNGGSSY